MTRPTRHLILALLLGTLAASAFAQFAGMGGGRGGRSAQSTGGARANDSTVSPESRSQQLRDRLYDLRLRLLITKEQSELWEAFYHRAWDLSGRVGFTQAPSGDQTAPEAVALRAAQAQERAAQLRALADATTQLYTVLTPDQRQIADRELPAAVP
ncbi:MAG: Spy/CpxP family protein refolding chaperone [Pseudomonadota bacterium]